MRQVFYETEDQRRAYLKQATAKDEVLLHDDFNVGPDGENRLTFEDAEPVVVVAPTELALLRRRIIDAPQSIQLVDIVRYVGLNFEGASE